MVIQKHNNKLQIERSKQCNKKNCYLPLLIRITKQRFCSFPKYDMKTRKTHSTLYYKYLENNSKVSLNVPEIV